MSPNLLKSLSAVAFVLVLGAAWSARAQAVAAPKGGRKGEKSRFVKLDAMRVHYLSAGEGEEALVFVHGWTCDASFWRMQTPAFEARTRVLAVDLPGHGRSDKPIDVAYTMDLFARAVEVVMRDAGVRRAVLVGHSMGAPVVRQFYRKHPEKTLALVLVDGGLRPFAPLSVMEQWVAPLRGPQHMEAAAKFVDGMLPPVHSEAVRAEIRATMLSAPRHVRLGAMEGMLDEEVWREDQVKAPVLAVLARGPFWPADSEQSFRKVAPDLDYRVWDGVSHFLMMDKPDEFNRTLADFVAGRKLLRLK